jgi:hypothetical protein
MDGGENWKPVGATGFHAVGFAGQTSGWAVGEDGTIAKYDRRD